MLLDVLAEFDNPTSSAALTSSLTASATVTSTYCYDTGIAGVPAALGPDGTTIGGPLLHDVGRGRAMGILVQVTTAYVSSGSATMEVDIISATSSDLTGSVTVYEKSAAIAKASLVAGYRYQFKTLPPKIGQRYLGVQYVVATAPMSGGALEAALVFNESDDHADIFG